MRQLDVLEQLVFLYGFKRGRGRRERKREGREGGSGRERVGGRGREGGREGKYIYIYNMIILGTCVRQTRRQEGGRTRPDIVAAAASISSVFSQQAFSLVRRQQALV